MLKLIGNASHLSINTQLLSQGVTRLRQLRPQALILQTRDHVIGQSATIIIHGKKKR